jgi:hypothetical protein
MNDFFMKKLFNFHCCCVIAFDDISEKHLMILDEEINMQICEGSVFYFFSQNFPFFVVCLFSKSESF